jgi:hypothetical protein
MIPKVTFALLAMLALAGCTIPESRTAEGVVASDEPRVWVVRASHVKGQTIADVYRCADGAEANQPPKPVCVKAPMVDQ